jgi:hypothetical protein
MPIGQVCPQTALFHVVKRLEKCLEHKEIVLGAFLDIKGAFDNTSFKTIITAVKERGLEETCCRWIEFMLDGRLVHTSLMGRSVTAKGMRGCPEGGVLSPLLWNIVVDRLLTATNDLGFSTFGYANDIAIIVQGKFAYSQGQNAKCPEHVSDVAVKEGLNISSHKIAIVPFTNRRKIEGLGPLNLHGKDLKMPDEVKYLGVILDSRLTRKQHLQQKSRKMQTTFVLVRRTW